MNTSDDLDNKLYGFHMEDESPDPIEIMRMNPCLSKEDISRAEYLLKYPFDWYLNSNYTEEEMDAARSEYCEHKFNL